MGKKIFFLILLFIILLLLHSVIVENLYNIFKTGPYSPFGNFPKINTENICDDNLWQHVYSPERLAIINKCITITGKIERLQNISDGDVHILIRIDENYPPLTNTINKIVWSGNIVGEVVCNGREDSDAQMACGTYKNTVIIPKVGQHIQITGSLVIDKSYGWTEIHPISHIQILN